MKTFPKPGTLSRWEPAQTSDHYCYCLPVRDLNLKCSLCTIEMRLTPSTRVTVVMCNLRDGGAQVWALKQVHTNFC